MRQMGSYQQLRYSERIIPDFETNSRYYVTRFYEK